MNQRTSARIHRQELPPVMRGRSGYRNAEPYLRRDFNNRCAYCCVHEQQMGSSQAFCIDHFKPQSRGGAVNDYSNLYWVCIPCNMIKHDKWPTKEQCQQGYRFADPCHEQDYGVHFVESDGGFLQPLTSCGEYHISMLRLNRAWLRELRLARLQKQSQLNEANQLREELERLITANSTDATVEMKQRLLSFLVHEIESLQSELAVAIPWISTQGI